MDMGVVKKYIHPKLAGGILKSHQLFAGPESGPNWIPKKIIAIAP
jgi:hypothetical protein